MIGFIAGAFAYLTDHVSKRWAESTLKENGETRSAAGGRVILRRLSNKGSAGGFFADKKTLVTVGSAAALASVIVSGVRLIGKTGTALKRLGLGLIAGGGAGNIMDRLQHGAVTDFISFRKRDGKTGRLVYNLADFAILAGTIFVFAGELIKGKKHGQ